MKALKLRAIGNSTGLVLPRNVLERMRLKQGDTLYLIETPSGYELTAFDPAVAQQLDAAEKVMREQRDVLRKLAE